MLINNIRKSPTCPIRNTIHAPTRGATSAVAWKWKLHIISIHAPTRGATLSASKLLLRNSYFNPRSYKRSDLIVEISRFQPVDFNPRSYKRSDFAEIEFTSESAKFQSTLLQEERPPENKSTGNADYFNPRSYKRSDSIQLLLQRFYYISIHAPTRGATVSISVFFCNFTYFNPRSYKRSDSVSVS